MEKDTNKNKKSELGGGFILGLIVGVIITLLLSTKKGREILKDLTDKGLNKFSDLQNALNMTEEEFEDEIEGDDYIPPEPKETKKELRYLAEEQKDAEEKHAKKPERLETKEDKNEKGGEAKKEARKFFKFKKN